MYYLIMSPLNCNVPAVERRQRKPLCLNLKSLTRIIKPLVCSVILICVEHVMPLIIRTEGKGTRWGTTNTQKPLTGVELEMF